MPIATGTAIALAAGIGAGASTTTAVLGSRAAGKAANAQVQGAQYAADLNKKAADEALAFQTRQYDETKANLQPYLAAGTTGLGALMRGLGLTPPDGTVTGPNAASFQAGTNTGAVPLGGLLTPYGSQFVAPTAATEGNDPGYEFRMKEGQKALERSAAAKGTLGSGGNLKSIMRYGQEYASGEYDKVYNRSLQEFQNAYNVYNQDQANMFNRLSAITGTGQTTVGQLMGAGQNFANNASNITVNSGAAQARSTEDAANARASGYVGKANAVSGGLSNLSNMAQMIPLWSIMGGGGGAAPASSTAVYAPQATTDELMRRMAAFNHPTFG